MYEPTDHREYCPANRLSGRHDLRMHEVAMTAQRLQLATGECVNHTRLPVKRWVPGTDLNWRILWGSISLRSQKMVLCRCHCLKNPIHNTLHTISNVCCGPEQGRIVSVQVKFSVTSIQALYPLSCFVKLFSMSSSLHIQKSTLMCAVDAGRL